MKPWLVKEWVIPEASAEFVYAMEEVLDVYELPYDGNNPVVCLDESPKQLISETRNSYQDEKGVVYEDYEYKREGVADIYMIVEPKGCKREILVKDNHNSISFGETLLHIANVMYPNAETITLVCDNLSAHKISVLYKLLPASEARAIVKRLKIVNTPKHGSWLNIAECELSVLSRQGLSNRIPNKECLMEQCNAWFKNRNNAQKGVNWQFTNKDARVKLKRLYPTIKY